MIEERASGAVEQPVVGRRKIPVNSNTLVAGPDTTMLGSLARRGVAWSSFQIGARHVLGIGVTAVLARILTPGDYGLVGMVTTFTVLLQSLADGGLSWATVQRKHLTMGQVHNLFWANVGLGLLMWALCALVGPGLVWFYARPELTMIALALGASFFLTGLSVQPLALLQRRMAFGRRTAVELGSQAVSAGVGISMALAGFGYWALVGQSLASSATTLVIAFSLAGYRPGRPRAGQSTLDLVKFGGYLSLAGVLLYFARNFDNVLIGKFEGADELGLYTRAYFLMTLPTMLAVGTIGRVLIPALSSIQHDRERLGRAYRQALLAIALVGCPIAAGLAVTAHEAVLLVYGPKWLSLVPLVVWLSIGGIAHVIYSTSGWLFTASGKGGAFFRWSAIISVAFMGGFALGIPFGALGVAIAVAVVTLVTAVPGLAYAHRAAGLDVWASLRPLPRVIAATVVMTVAVWGVGVWAVKGGLTWPGVLATKVVTGIGLYGLLIWIFVDVSGVVRSVFRRSDMAL